MDYNSNRKKLFLPEYGRNIQNMVNHIMAIEDRDERNRAARSLVDIMGNMYPYLRDINDFKHKLWDHLAIMSEFTLDIDYPYDPPSPSLLHSKPNRVPYSAINIKYLHYGKILEDLIEKAAEYEEGAERDLLIQLLANHMKKCYLVWNKDSVTDDKIFEDIEKLSGGRIKFSEDYKLTDSKDLLYRSSPAKKKLQQNKRQNPK
ncbi:MAG: DUF4290 domain-containing protein [Bacteroidota bacterium]|nr:DUF4290 domain-containing protein [Bacteroidota bacterium]MDP4206164.1 DUF4290 domain-containing protein [Bacteroidota bacterium]